MNKIINLSFIKHPTGIFLNIVILIVILYITTNPIGIIFLLFINFIINIGLGHAFEAMMLSHSNNKIDD